jgi:hypothetical protein
MISDDFWWHTNSIPATFEFLNDSKVMAYMNNVHYRPVSNARISARVRQALVLISTILVGMLVSVIVGA